MNKRYECSYGFYHLSDIIDGDIYEFGVYSGTSITRLAMLTKGQDRKIYGFDSFEGLPVEKEGLNKVSDWEKGCYDSRKIFKKSPEKVLQKYFNINFPNTVTLIKGWYNNLDSSLISKYNMKPAAFVHFDCDLYVSTMDAYKFLCENNLLVNGTIIDCNDIWWGENQDKTGEGLANIDAQKLYNFKLKDISLHTYKVEK